MQFEIKSYEGALPIRFGMSESEVISLLGPPAGRSSNFRRDHILEYLCMNIGFGKGDSVEHVGFHPGSDVIAFGKNLFAEGTFEALVQIDGDAFELLGLIVLLNLGIMFGGFHDGDEAQKGVAVFEKGAYDPLMDRMRPYRPTVA